jgi:hypothetical protein
VFDDQPPKVTNCQLNVTVAINSIIKSWALYGPIFVEAYECSQYKNRST